MNVRETMSQFLLESHPQLYLMCIDCADNVPQLYCIPSVLLIMCLDCTGHP